MQIKWARNKGYLGALACIIRCNTGKFSFIFSLVSQFCEKIILKLFMLKTSYNNNILHVICCVTHCIQLFHYLIILFFLQINEEFKRITTVGLESTFMAKLDKCTPKLMDLASSRGGAKGERIRRIKDMLLEVL